jgi:hypothetical protein
VCDHPKCVQPEQGVKARFRDHVYCSDRCRYLHGCLLRQQRRRDEGLDAAVRRARDLQRKYGITVEDWDRLYDEQLGRCAICVVTLAEVKVCVDHDHTTGEVRGLLCNRCNQGLGYFADSPAILCAATKYLEHAAQSRLDVGEEVLRT